MHAVYILINFFDNNHLVFLKIFYKICIYDFVSTIKFGCSFCDITLNKKNLSENFRENAVLIQQQEGPGRFFYIFTDLQFCKRGKIVVKSCNIY